MAAVGQAVIKVPRAFLLKKYVIVAVAAVLLSLIVITTSSRDSVPFCVNSAGCQADTTLRGKVALKSYGFPAMYKQESIFNPANTNQNSGGYAGYAQATVTTKRFSLPAVVANIIFWAGLLLIPARFVKPRQPNNAASNQLTPTDL